MKNCWNPILFFLCMLPICCSSNDDAEITADGTITVAPNPIVADSEGGSVVITVTSDAEWRITPADSWVSCRPSGGLSGVSEVTLTVAANPSQSASRTTTLVVKSTVAQLSVQLTQGMTVEELTVADANLRRCLVENYDADGDGIFSVAEAAALTSLDVSGRQIASFGELAAFPALTSLDVSDNLLETLEPGLLPQLVSLDCSKNRLAELDLSRNMRLATLDATENPLTKIYVWAGFTAPEGFSIPDGAEYVYPDIFVPEGYALLWSDEFEGTALDTSNWTCEQGAGGWGNSELQYYTDREENVSVQDGTLRITAVKESYKGSPVTSARLITLKKVAFTYGYVVASIKLPRTANGLWPAFWMMGNDFSEVGWPACGETDIVEMGNSGGFGGTQDRYLNGACHWGQSYANHVTYDYSLQDDAFHTFTCIWDKDYIRMYIDLETHPEAEPYFEMKILDTMGNNVFRKDNFILLNLAVGGQFPGIYDIGGVTALDSGRATMEVDYVRVFQKK